MNELVNLFNKGEYTDCQVSGDILRCPITEDTTVWCSECIFCNSSQANIKIKELIPILLID